MGMTSSNQDDFLEMSRFHGAMVSSMTFTVRFPDSRQGMGIRMLFTDMEGTLFEKQQVRLRTGDPSYPHSLWSRLMYELGEEALKEDAGTILKWEAGRYRSYLEWVDESVMILQKHGLSQELFERTLAGIQYNPGVQETFGVLHVHGIKTAIVTGGFYEQARRAQQDLRITHAYAAVDLFWSGDGSIAHWNMFPSDYEGKVDFVRLIMREYGFSRQECGFVGDGKNDALVAREVGISFAYQAHPELREASSHAVEEFSQILKWIPGSLTADPFRSSGARSEKESEMHGRSWW